MAQSPFYRGKTITILNGNDPGGTGDMRMRALIPYLRKYIPGEPTILAEFMAGGGGRKVANHIYRGVPRDGLTIGFPPGGFVSLAILGEPGVQYDLDKLMFLGTPESATQYIFYTRKDAGSNRSEIFRMAANRRWSFAIPRPTPRRGLSFCRRSFPTQ